MESQLLWVIGFTMIIHLISTLSYSVQIVGIRTGRVALSFSLFNMMVLVSRTANTFQVPLLAKTVERDIVSGLHAGRVLDFRLLILSASAATLLGAFAIPTFQRLFAAAVNSFSRTKSVPRLIFKAVSRRGFAVLAESIRLPSSRNLALPDGLRGFPWRIFILNTLVVAILTVGVISSLYAAYFNPLYRTTASTLSSIVNGMATILMFVFVDPFINSMMDDVVASKVSEAWFRRCIVFMVISRLIGTLVAQAIFLPAAQLIAAVSRFI